MYRCDPIVFTGPTRKFVELLTPMLLSNRFKTAGKNNREAFLRNIDNIIPLPPRPEKNGSRTGKNNKAMDN